MEATDPPMTDARELRLRYSAEGMTLIIDWIDHMSFGELPAFMAIFLTHASNAANWHPVEPTE